MKKKHVLKSCEKVEVVCNYCKKKLMKSDLYNHIKECDSIEEICDYCRNIYLKGYLKDSNHKEECGNKTILCMFCKVNFLLKEEKQHLLACEGIKENNLNENILKLTTENPDFSNSNNLINFMYDITENIKNKYNTLLLKKDEEIKEVLKLNNMFKNDKF